MTRSRAQSPSEPRPRSRSFQRGGLFIIGAGESLDDVQAGDVWLAADTEAAVEVRR